MSSLDLTGLWSQPGDCFLWASAQLTHRRASAHPGDYWVRYACGACLTSHTYGAAGRLTGNLLHITPAARPRLDGPWRVLKIPGVVALIGSRAQRKAQDEGWLVDGDWRAPAEAWLWLRQHNYGVLVQTEAGEVAAAEERPPHGGRVSLERMLRIDAREISSSRSDRRLLAAPASRARSSLGSVEE